MNKTSFLEKIRAMFRSRRINLTLVLLVAILLLGAFLRLYRLGEAGVGNTYYAATVKSMLLSWKNFFFAAFEPGGSLSVDKPPLGFWVQAVSARIFGLNGFALALPNAIAGIISIGMVFLIVRRPFGNFAGLAGALALAVMPVAVSTERNNTIDGLLVMVLLLAAWAFLRAASTGRIRWLWTGSLLIGLGFNIKMLEAFLPLPALYAVYFFGVKKIWWKKILQLSAATILLLTVSLSWAVTVDWVPATDRPYVDSTGENSVLELIFGHNGIERLINLRQSVGWDDRADGFPLPSGAGGNPPQGILSSGNVPQPPAGRTFTQPPIGTGALQRPGNGAAPTGSTGSMDFGSAGTLRLFTEPLVGEASWLLPFVIGGLVLTAAVLWKRPFGHQHLSLIFFALWLLPEAVYFTYSQGLMHAYYLIMLGAPIAAITAMTGWALWQVLQTHARTGWMLAFGLIAATLIFQAHTLWGKTTAAFPALVLAGLVFSLGIILIIFGRSRTVFRSVGLTAWFLSMLIAPGLWSVLTTFNSTPNGGLPYAGPSVRGSPPGMPGQNNGGTGSADDSLRAYLLANTSPGTYLLATERASDAAPYILSTERPVLTFGGFLGEYDEVSVTQLITLVKNGSLRFILLGQETQRHAELSAWVRQNCTLADSVQLSKSGGLGGNTHLYDCGAQ